MVSVKVNGVLDGVTVCKLVQVVKFVEAWMV